MNGQTQYTVKASEALQEAIKTATARGNPETTPSHLLLALMQQEGGIAPRFLAKVGAPTGQFESELKQALDRLPANPRAVFDRCSSRRKRSRPSSRTNTFRSNTC